jgi:hypothetical protein
MCPGTEDGRSPKPPQLLARLASRRSAPQNDAAALDGCAAEWLPNDTGPLHACNERLSLKASRSARADLHRSMWLRKVSEYVALTTDGSSTCGRGSLFVASVPGRGVSAELCSLRFACSTAVSGRWPDVGSASASFLGLTDAARELGVPAGLRGSRGDIRGLFCSVVMRLFASAGDRRVLLLLRVPMGLWPPDVLLGEGRVPPCLGSAFLPVCNAGEAALLASPCDARGLACWACLASVAAAGCKGLLRGFPSAFCAP